MKIEKCKTPFLFALCILHFALFSLEGWAGMAVQTCFSPLGKCSNHIVRELAQARSEILVAVYAFTSDDLAMMFAGTYDTDFYRSARDLLHQEVRRPASGAETAGTSLDARWDELKRLEPCARRGGVRALPVC